MRTQMSSPLILEVYVMSKLQGKPHVLTFYDAGLEHNYVFMVMQLAGKSLEQLFYESKVGFSLGTTARLGVQCLEAIHDLHMVGFVHRNITPSNFVLGNERENYRTVYIIDFAMSRQFADMKTGVWNLPRAKCCFCGTVRYASPHAHNGLEQSCRDDLWSLFYMLVEFALGKLPWQHETDLDAAGFIKQTIRPNDLLGPLPKPFYEFMEGLERLTYTSIPDYAWFISKLEDVCSMVNCSKTDKYEWEDEEEKYC
ncbi:Tau tubulin kinase 1 [Trichuris trichiura]|uniref:Tau tubulin kinase 1 n=1 Tax=Trichuris trichiura TaxID=36087 RepID=A0A077ZE01_TRITR|nr:Tau tubulin kinase 1 [Trichuris trichiura]